ncbi:MAG: hypothetical protein HY290_28320 [Planctomycetia bacterium]|nr:hypothetical protein [Planctomycetia bacterium]
MNNLVPSLVAGAALIVVGCGLIWWHLSTRATQCGDAALSDSDRLYFARQFRRRVQISLLVILLGVMIPVGDSLMQRDHPRFWTWYWIAVLMIALWIMALAALDWLSFRTYRRAARASLASLERKRRELEAEVDRFRKRGSNGRHTD